MKGIVTTGAAANSNLTDLVAVWFVESSTSSCAVPACSPASATCPGAVPAGTGVTSSGSAEVDATVALRDISGSLNFLLTRVPEEGPQVQ
jgi:hypothetical protein